MYLCVFFMVILHTSFIPLPPTLYSLFFNSFYSRSFMLIRQKHDPVSISSAARRKTPLATDPCPPTRIPIRKLPSGMNDVGFCLLCIHVPNLRAAMESPTSSHPSSIIHHPSCLITHHLRHEPGVAHPPPAVRLKPVSLSIHERRYGFLHWADSTGSRVATQSVPCAGLRSRFWTRLGRGFVIVLHSRPEGKGSGMCASKGSVEDVWI